MYDKRDDQHYYYHGKRNVNKRINEDNRQDNESQLVQERSFPPTRNSHSSFNKTSPKISGNRAKRNHKGRKKSYLRNCHPEAGSICLQARQKIEFQRTYKESYNQTNSSSFYSLSVS